MSKPNYFLHLKRKLIIEAAVSRAIEINSKPFDRIISFSDGLWDLKAAQKLGYEFIGIGDLHKETLEQHGMKRHFSDFLSFQADLL